MATKYDVTLTLTTGMLGTVPKDPSVYETYITTKKAAFEKSLTNVEVNKELESIESVEARGWTGFRREVTDADWDNWEIPEGWALSAGKFSKKQLRHEKKQILSTTQADAYLSGEKKPYGPSPTGDLFLPDYMIRGFFKTACAACAGFDEKTLSKGIKAYKKLIVNMVFVFPQHIPLDISDAIRGVLERPLRASTPQGERVTLARSDTVSEGTILKFEVCVLGKVSEKLLREWLDYGIYSGLGQWRNGSHGRFTYKMKKQKME